MTMRRVMLALLLGACGDEAITIRPVIDLPPPGSDAYPMDLVSTLTLSVAEAGGDVALALNTGTPASPPTLADVPFGENLVLHLTGENAGVEVAYGRSAPFDVPGGVAAPHLYFSRTVAWGEAPAPLFGVRTDGQGYAGPACTGVFVAGGPAITAVDVFDVTTGAFTSLDAEVIARTGGTLSPLPMGRAFAIGGVDADGDRLDSAEVIDPARDVVEVRKDGVPLLTEHAAESLSDSVFVAGGFSAPGDLVETAWEFRIDAVGQVEPPKLVFESIRFPRAGHTMTRLRDDVGADVLIVGGRDAFDVPVPKVEIYRPPREAFECLGDPAMTEEQKCQLGGAELLSPRWDHQAVLMPGGFVLVIGGRNPEPVTSLELYDPVQGRFVPAGSLPAGAGVVDFTATSLPDGRVLVAGGHDEAGAPTDDALIIQSIDGRIVVVGTSPMEVPRAGHTAVLLCDGTVLVVGGTDDGTHAAERYNPPSAGRR
jgi:hypothetical protein